MLVLAGLGVYLAAEGLDKADKMASVIGLFVGIAALAVALYERLADRNGSGGEIAGTTPSEERSTAVAGDDNGTVSSGDGPVQNITASAPGATAQGAMFGNVINHHHAARPLAGSQLPPGDEDA
ncbi:hypothetical protein [Nonomuraea sp. NPDC001699]